MARQTVVNERFVVLIDAVAEKHRRTRRRGFDRLLCNYVYNQFCPDCPQYRCKKRRI